MEFLQSLWNWYWSGAHIPVTTENPSGADPITMLFLLWNLVMEPIWVRVGVVGVGVLIVVERISSSKNKQKMEMEKKSISVESNPSGDSKPKEKPVESDVKANPPSDSIVDQAENAENRAPLPESTSESTRQGSGLGEDASQAPEGSDDPLTIEEVREALNRANKTQTELADALNVTRFYVSKILSGAKPLTPELKVKCRQALRSWGVDLPER